MWEWLQRALQRCPSLPCRRCAAGVRRRACTRSCDKAIRSRIEQRGRRLTLGAADCPRRRPAAPGRVGSGRRRQGARPHGAGRGAGCECSQGLGSAEAIGREAARGSARQREHSAQLASGRRRRRRRRAGRRWSGASQRAVRRAEGGGRAGTRRALRWERGRRWGRGRRWRRWSSGRGSRRATGAQSGGLGQQH